MKSTKTKVTALMPTTLIEQVIALTEQETTTEALIVALSEWVAQSRIQKLTAEVGKNPLRFAAGITAKKLRALNQSRR